MLANTQLGRKELAMLEVVTFVAAIGSGLMAGLLFTFSAFMMAVLGRLPAAQGIRTMQDINIAIITPVFLVLFVGTSLASLVVVVGSVLAPTANRTAYGIAGGVLYLAVVLITATANIPLNNRLASVEPETDEGDVEWRRYLRLWTRWNHLRTACAILAAVGLTLAVRSG